MNTDDKYKRDSIELFLLKTDEIRNSNYFDFVSKNEISYSIKGSIDNETSMETNHPDLESIKSVVLTIRLFIQDNDRISIRKIASLMRELNFNNEFVERYNRGRNNLNEFLDSVAVNYNGEDLSFRKIIDVFFYGYFTHLEEKQYDIYRKWKNDKYFYKSKLNDLLCALNTIIRFLLFFEKQIRIEFEKNCV